MSAPKRAPRLAKRVREDRAREPIADAEVASARDEARERIANRDRRADARRRREEMLAEGVRYYTAATALLAIPEVRAACVENQHATHPLVRSVGTLLMLGDRCIWSAPRPDDQFANDDEPGKMTGITERTAPREYRSVDVPAPVCARADEDEETTTWRVLIARGANAYDVAATALPPMANTEISDTAERKRFHRWIKSLAADARLRLASAQADLEDAERANRESAERPGLAIHIDPVRERGAVDGLTALLARLGES